MNNIINITNLKKSFNGVDVLKGFNLILNKGENLVVIGKSGQGKSVSIQCIAGMIIPDEGKIFVLEHEIENISPTDLKELRTKIGFLFQHGALYDSMTVRENLAFPLQRVLHITDLSEIEKRSKQALEDIGLAEIIDKMPADLSGGQRKRLALARMLIVNPSIILYDEPTTGLDTVTSKEISMLIRSIQKKYNASSIIITHYMSCARLKADKIIVINDGK
ncbi:MAG: ATP-binding cassette domain-containing protein, partial [Ignavibacteria bacterium]|nr:ATP-binding cassette domain-containing protein [Ignavibacteria bacterium]